MSTVSVWLLSIATTIYGGQVVHVAPHAFPTLADCEQVRKNLATDRSYATTGRCIQTTIVKP